jgi:hypothetical protein
VLLVSGALFCLVYGFSNAAAHSWHTPSTYGFLAAGVALGAAFALWQVRAAYPLLPPRMVLDRNRGGAYLSMLIASAGLFRDVLVPDVLPAAGAGLLAAGDRRGVSAAQRGLILAANLSTVINTGTFGVAPQDAGVASATVTVGQQLGASIGTSLLNTIFAGAVTSYLAANIAAARIIGRHAVTGLALAHGYDTAFWWPSPPDNRVATAQAEPDPGRAR